MIEDKIKPVKELFKHSGVKILLYGQAGEGKTPFLDGIENSVILSMEKGLLSIKNSNSMCYEASDFKEVKEFLNWWFKSSESRKYKTLCIDSLSEMTTMCLESIVRSGEFKNKMQEYGKLSEVIYKIVSMLCLDNRNIIVTAKIGRSKTEDGTETLRPMFEGQKLESLIPHRFDEIFYVKNFDIYTKSTDEFHARDRSGILEEVIENGVFKSSEIIERLANGKKIKE